MTSGPALPGTEGDLPGHGTFTDKVKTVLGKLEYSVMLSLGCFHSFCYYKHCFSEHHTVYAMNVNLKCLDQSNILNNFCFLFFSFKPGPDQLSL